MRTYDYIRTYDYNSYYNLILLFGISYGGLIELINTNKLTLGNKT